MSYVPFQRHLCPEVANGSALACPDRAALAGSARRLRGLARRVADPGLARYAAAVAAEAAEDAAPFDPEAAFMDRVVAAAGCDAFAAAVRRAAAFTD